MIAQTTPRLAVTAAKPTANKTQSGVGRVLVMILRIRDYYTA